MNRKQAEIRINELVAILTEANRKYYVDNAPTLSDYEFDLLLKELEALEKEFPEFTKPRASKSALFPSMSPPREQPWKEFCKRKLQS